MPPVPHGLCLDSSSTYSEDVPSDKIGGAYFSSTRTIYLVAGFSTLAYHICQAHFQQSMLEAGIEVPPWSKDNPYSRFGSWVFTEQGAAYLEATGFHLNDAGTAWVADPNIDVGWYARSRVQADALIVCSIWLDRESHGVTGVTGLTPARLEWAEQWLPSPP